MTASGIPGQPALGAYIALIERWCGLIVWRQYQRQLQQRHGVHH